ncbi:TPA: iron-containing alcohol dehydrogenase [Bacillus thuringiensis]|jgi:alcohol dehydrogenase|uniref:Iron-containing alcohol dehydrogenase n=7 Tax=Bacillus cereus group TaxID=86661 RepID=A0A9X7DAJ1_BACCE|nr:MULTISPECIES: iron-containing alcohol dehydrogenase [Bacillus]CGG45690.1 iron-containing alcohol dehydrogenase [Streptococcus pneumoniae]BCA32777.1 NADH-dependent alcohol dehydrogenase [Bacillus wiedmannii]AGE79582.1 alcohol dehydrogenase, iron-containing [Bacillus thuringiensis serovar kurstaki str. HD73]AHX19734.1 butanol dehydrogenase [Bacillus bombysepticus str. Wang]AHZ52563.1 putative NADH-dependent butanol dehydrogenase 1 [Bacillus thuringiensis serovar kurstaki str. YBT-1520]
MQNFVFRNPTKLIFGKGQLEQLKTEIPQFGKKVLLVYGGGSIKRNGIYDNVISILKDINAEVFELTGVEPNPRVSTVKKGIQICKENGVEFILAVGGGSVIDCTKAIAAGSKYDGDVWDIVTKKTFANEALPFGTVLTLAATGSEMNAGSVITNWETNEKYGWGSPVTFPQFSILDPVHTTSVPKDQTIYGMVDIMSHVLEQYFHHGTNTELQDRYCEAVLKTVIETAPKLLSDLENYEHRETILYCGTMALNGILAMGVKGDWATHNIEHAVSAVHDIPHGGGLAILFPNWMKHVVEENVSRFKQFAIRVFDIETDGKTDKEVALEGIKALRQFWTSIEAPATLADYGIGENEIDIMANKAMAYGEFGNFKKLNKDDVLSIYKASL